jgi:N-acetylmuramoyl-L-alanine amidase
VLWSDEGPRRLVQARGVLARGIAEQMVKAGFAPYDGFDYEGLYVPDRAQAGVFIDRHVPGARIFLLRRPRVPSVIVETHHGLDLSEVQQWKQVATRERFADALAAALAKVLDKITVRRTNRRNRPQPQKATLRRRTPA